MVRQVQIAALLFTVDCGVVQGARAVGISFCRVGSEKGRERMSYNFRAVHTRSKVIPESFRKAPQASPHRLPHDTKAATQKIIGNLLAHVPTEAVALSTSLSPFTANGAPPLRSWIAFFSSFSLDVRGSLREQRKHQCLGDECAGVPALDGIDTQQRAAADVCLLGGRYAVRVDDCHRIFSDCDSTHHRAAASNRVPYNPTSLQEPAVSEHLIETALRILSRSSGGEESAEVGGPAEPENIEALYERARAVAAPPNSPGAHHLERQSVIGSYLDAGRAALQEIVAHGEAARLDARCSCPGLELHCTADGSAYSLF